MATMHDVEILLPRPPASCTNYNTANYRTTNHFGPIGPPSQSTGALQSGFGGNRRRTNTAASFDMVSARGSTVREAQRDDAAPRGGVHIAANAYEVLEDYTSASNAGTDKVRGLDEALD